MEAWSCLGHASFVERLLLFHTRQERQGSAGPGLTTRPDASPAFGERDPVPLGESEGLISCPSVCW